MAASTIKAKAGGGCCQGITDTQGRDGGGASADRTFRLSPKEQWRSRWKSSVERAHCGGSEDREHCLSLRSQERATGHRATQAVVRRGRGGWVMATQSEAWGF